MLSNIGAKELLILLGIILLLFGSRKIVELARGLGESSKEIKKVKNELTSEDHKEVADNV